MSIVQREYYAYWVSDFYTRHTMPLADKSGKINLQLNKRLTRQT